MHKGEIGIDWKEPTTCKSKRGTLREERLKGVIKSIQKEEEETTRKTQRWVERTTSVEVHVQVRQVRGTRRSRKGTVNSEV